MWVCPKCHEEVEDNLGSCWNCQTDRGDTSQTFSIGKSTIEDTYEKSYTDDEYEKQKSGGFFSFRTMVSRTLIQIIYILGMMAIIFSGILIIVQAANIRYGASEKFMIGLGVLFLGNLVWRLICEAWILLYNIHDVLVSIERKV